jgi:hypothetical protein
LRKKQFSEKNKDATSRRASSIHRIFIENRN